MARLGSEIAGAFDKIWAVSSVAPKSNMLTGVGHLWHRGEYIAEVCYELSQTEDPLDPVSIYGNLFGISEKEVQSLFGQRLTLKLEDGEAADCFFANSAGRIVVAGNGFRL
jgi:hypothetical protein